MALIKCPECSKDVSDKATACIHCGYPLALSQTKPEKMDVNNGKREPKKYTIKILGCTGSRMAIISVLRNHFQYGVDDAKKAAFSLPIILETDKDIKEITIIAQKFTDAEITHEIYKYGNKVDLALQVRDKTTKGARSAIIVETRGSVLKKCPSCGQSSNQPDEYYCPKCNVRYEKIKDNTFIKPIEETEEAVNVPRCPTCQSTDIRKKSVISKFGSIAIWGVLATGNISKQWHCNNCGSEC